MSELPRHSCSDARFSGIKIRTIVKRFVPTGSAWRIWTTTEPKKYCRLRQQDFAPDAFDAHAERYLGRLLIQRDGEQRASCQLRALWWRDARPIFVALFFYALAFAVAFVFIRVLF